MEATVNGRFFKQFVDVPSSKSMLHRLLICASLSDRPTVIEASDPGDDVAATASALRQLGAVITETEHGYAVDPVDMRCLPERVEIDCGESGSTLRFLLPVTAALGVNASFVMHGRLSSRPLDALLRILESGGCRVIKSGDTVILSGRLRKDRFEYDASETSQYTTGLLLALPLCGGTIIPHNEVSSPYIELTCRCLNEFGININRNGGTYSAEGGHISPGSVVTDGDWSAAAFPLAAGAGNGCTVNIRTHSLQGDEYILDILKKAGADVSFYGTSVSVNRGSLHGFSFDAGNYPDIVPISAVLASVCEGNSVISGVSRLILKESNRIESICSMLSSLGGKAEYSDGTLYISGTGLHGGVVDPSGDHRIAMAAAAASVFTEDDITILNAECTGKSWKGFWNACFREVKYD